jgi:hypothetical protein
MSAARKQVWLRANNSMTVRLEEKVRLDRSGLKLRDLLSDVVSVYLFSI